MQGFKMWYLPVIAVGMLISLTTSCVQKDRSSGNLGELKYLEKTDNLTSEQRVKVLDSMWAEAKQRPDDTLTSQLLKVIAYRYYYDDEYDKQRSIMHNMYKRAERRNDSVTMAYALYNTGISHEAEDNSDSSYFYHLRAGKIYENLRDSLNLGLTLHSRAKILFYHGNYAEAEGNEIRAIKIFRRLNKPEQLCNSYITLASCLRGQHNYIKALEYQQLALNETERMDKAAVDEADINYYKRLALGNMGVVYDKLGDFPKAINYYNRAIAIPDCGKKELGVFLGNRGYAKMMTGQPEDDYLPDLFSSVHILDSLGANYNKLDPEKSIAKHFLKSGDTLRSVTLLKLAYRHAHDSQSYEDMLETLSLLIVNDKKNTALHSERYFALNDSLHQAERATRNKFARIEFETAAIERQNKDLHRRFNMALWAGAVVLLIAAGVVAIIRLRARNKELEYTQKQQEANEKIYNLLLQQEMEAENARIQERNRIAMELHDGVINRIFTTRFNLMQLNTTQGERKEQLVHELQETQDEIRKLSHDLKESFVTENEGYAEAVKQLVEKQQEDNGPLFDVYVDKFINWGTVTPESRVSLFRIIQEACTNARKYSQAKNCHVALMAQGSHVKLRIWDDGVGFDPRKTKPGIGLRNIDERVRAMGGTFNLTANEGKGTTIEITV